MSPVARDGRVCGWPGRGGYIAKGVALGLVGASQLCDPELRPPEHSRLYGALQTILTQPLGKFLLTPRWRSDSWPSRRIRDPSVAIPPNVSRRVDRPALVADRLRAGVGLSKRRRTGDRWLCEVATAYGGRSWKNRDKPSEREAERCLHGRGRGRIIETKIRRVYGGLPWRAGLDGAGRAGTVWILDGLESRSSARSPRA